MKKSEFYAAMCICIILCSMSTVFAVSYQPQIIQPTKPYQKCFKSVSTATNTYVTLVDITGSGTLDYIEAYLGVTSNINLIIKITVDGTAYEIKGPIVATGLVETAGKYINDGGTAKRNACSLIYNSKIYFKTSLKVEVKHNVGTDQAIEATCNYATE